MLAIMTQDVVCVNRFNLYLVHHGKTNMSIQIDNKVIGMV